MSQFRDRIALARGCFQGFIKKQCLFILSREYINFDGPISDEAEVVSQPCRPDGLFSSPITSLALCLDVL